LSIKGQYICAGSTRSHLVTLVRDGDNLIFSCTDWSLETRQLWPHTKVSVPLGKTPYRLNFANGDSFETMDHGQVESLLLGLSQRGSGWLHRLERNWRWVLISLLLLITLLGLSWVYGTRWAASWVAPLVPQQAIEAMDESALRFMHETLADTQLTSAQQLRVEGLVEQLPKQQRIVVKMFAVEDMGANAFALPGGTIVITDELVERLTDNELLAVMLHEVGHVEARHGMQSVLYAMGNSLILAIWLGDVGGAVEELILSGPVVLQQLSYGRDMEREADAISARYLESKGISAGCLGSALQKISEGDEEPMGNYFNTHPSSKERVVSLGSECHRL